MPFYLWPMTSLCPVLAGYRLVKSGPCACLPSMYVQNLLAAHTFAVVGLYSLPSVLDNFLVSLSFMACPIWGWAFLDGGLYFFFSPPFFLLLSPTIPLHHSYCKAVLLQPGWAFLGLPFILPLMAELGHWFLCYIISGLCVPFVFPWASSALFLTLHYHGLLLNSLGFLGPIILFFIIGVHGLAINPLLSLLSLLWVCHGSFSLFHIIYCPWFAFSLFPGSFKPIYLFKIHLFISWVCDPLFLSLGLNGFSIRLPTPFYPCCWASSSYLGFQNGPQQRVVFHRHSSGGEEHVGVESGFDLFWIWFFHGFLGLGSGEWDGIWRK